MIRGIVFDTETTGLDPAQGHRIVEVGAVELVHHVPTGRTFHTYVNPERDVPEEAARVHGLTAEMLAGHPVFAEIVEPLLEFVGDAPLLIHNAVFDMRFLNAELLRCGREPLSSLRATCTLTMAQRRYPGAPNSLDALCRRFAVDATSRTLHGALLDCRLLADVYLHLIGGRQVGLDLAMPGVAVASASAVGIVAAPRVPRVFLPSAEEQEAHAAFLAKLSDPVWLAT